MLTNTLEEFVKQEMARGMGAIITGITTREPNDMRANDRAVYFIEHLSSADRKEFPIATGVMDYFPDALALVARVSKLGNDKHNPGQPLHWAREKSTDQPDTILRHMTTRDQYEIITLPDGRVVAITHKAMVAWRALAQLQEEAETQFEAARAAGLPYRPGLPLLEPQAAHPDLVRLVGGGSPNKV